MISIQQHDFKHADEYATLQKSAGKHGAIVTFTGLVREFNNDKHIAAMHLEHYPEMAEKALSDIVAQARQRWSLGDIRIIHRVGVLEACEQIVFVGVTSAHRADAFNACQFIMDVLKTDVPIWKKEGSTADMQWVDAKTSDDVAAKRWQQSE